MNILNLLKQIGCTNAKSDGICNISELRDKCWVKMFAEQGYTKGELIFPDGGHSSFFLVLPYWATKMKQLTNFEINNASENVDAGGVSTKI